MEQTRDYYRELQNDFPDSGATHLKDRFNFSINHDTFLKQIMINATLFGQNVLTDIELVEKIINKYFELLVQKALTGSVIETDNNFFSVTKIAGPYKTGSRLGYKYEFNWYFNENKRKLFIFVASDNVVADIELKVSETAKDYQFKDEFEKTYLHT